MDMKKLGFWILMGLAFSICFGLTACNKEGGTLEVINNYAQKNVQIEIDGAEVFNGVIEKGKSVKKSKDTDFSYTIKYPCNTAFGIGTATDSGIVAGGETIKVWLDE
jgi:predicted small secreted protein